MRGKLLRGCSVFCGLLLLWQLASYSGIPTFLLPSPAAVAEALWNNRSYLASHTLVTLSEILSGMALGVALGMVLALCMTMSPRLQRWVMPLVLTSQAIPVFALAPLLVLWFGFGMSAKVMMAVLVIFFPVTYQKIPRRITAGSELFARAFAANLAAVCQSASGTQYRTEPAGVVAERAAVRHRSGSVR